MGLQCCPLGLEFGIQTGEVNDGQTIFRNLKMKFLERINILRLKVKDIYIYKHTNQEAKPQNYFVQPILLFNIDKVSISPPFSTLFNLELKGVKQKSKISP